MSKKTRLTILIVCALLFLTTTPYIVLYSLGYRIDFEKRKIIATGGIYIKASPSGTDIIINSKIENKTGLFSNSVFIQNLLPKQHNVLIKKEGYHDYHKNVAVKEKEVTKLDSVILFKKDISFERISEKDKFLPLGGTKEEKFLIKNGNLYHSDTFKNSLSKSEEKDDPILKKIVAYSLFNNSIIWLDSDGYLQISDSAGKKTEKLSQVNIKINKKKTYKIWWFDKSIFLQEDNSLLLFDKISGSFENFYSPVKGIKISPDGQKIIYFNDNEILYSIFPIDLSGNKVFLHKFKNTISDCQWINSDYFVCSITEEIIISEIDIRGNINVVSLPKSILLNGKSFEIKNPNIFFNQQDKKLYILTENPDNNLKSKKEGEILLVSEKLIP